MTTTRRGRERETEKKNYCMHVFLYVKCHKLRDIFTIMNFSRERVKAIKIKKLLSIQFSCLIRSSLISSLLNDSALFMWAWVWKCVTWWFMELVSVFCVVSECVYMKKSHSTVINKAVLILSERTIFGSEFYDLWSRAMCLITLKHKQQQ